MKDRLHGVLLMNVEVPTLDRVAEKKARQRLDRLTKPQGSLGRLEDLAAQIAGMKGQPVPQIGRKVIFTVAADHGVVEEGVSAYPQSVTVQMVLNFLRGGAGINVLARHVGAEVIVVDAGVAGEFPPMDGLIRRKIRPGTANMAKEPAMTRSEAEQTVEAGMQIFTQVYEKGGIGLVGLGDMGIGNTTASSAITAVLTGSSVRAITGRGTGLEDAALDRKVQVIERVLQLHRPDPDDALDVLHKVGGFEIGYLAGITLAAAQRRVPVIVDGFITTAAALIAWRICPEVRHYLVASHRSVEPGHATALKTMELQPLLDLRMRLGEGTGAALAMGLVEAACKILTEMATFDEAGVDEKAE